MKIRIPRIGLRGSLTRVMTYCIALVSTFMIFFSFNNTSWGSVCIVATLVLIILNCRYDYLKPLFPFVLVCGITMLLLFMSGRASERGFNAPVNNALKYIHLMFVVALSIAMKKMSRQERHTILKWTMVSLTISVLISLYYLLRVDIYAVRFSELRGFPMVIGFDQFYGLCMFLCVLFFTVISCKQGKNKTKYIVLIIIWLACVGLSLLVTGLLLAVMGIALGLAVAKYNESKSKTILWVIAIIILGFVVLVFRTQISDWIYSITDSMNPFLKDRLRSVTDTLLRTDHNIAYSYDRREELAGYSMSTFRNHPLFGIGYKYYGYGIIGCHQEWQDMLGVFGLFGATVFVILMICHSRYLLKGMDNEIDKSAYFIALLVYIVFGFLNPCLTPPSLSVLFIVAPNASCIFPQRDWMI